MAVTRTWVEHTIENAVSAAATTALAAMGSQMSGLIGHSPWYGVVGASAFAALFSVLSACAGLRVGPNNGTASFLPKVVDANRTRERDS